MAIQIRQLREWRGYNSFTIPYVFGIPIFDENDIKLLRSQYPGNYKVLLMLDGSSFENYIVFDDPKEELFFILKYL